jgi:hypothetical protein
MSAEWCTLDQIPHFNLAQRYVSGDIQTSLEITVTVTFDMELPVTVICDRELYLYLLYEILKEYWVISADWSTLDSHPHSSLAQSYVSEGIQTSLELQVTFTCDAELELYVLYLILKQNWVMSARWSTLDSLPPFLSCTEICVLVNTDIYAINSYGYIF